MPYSLHLAVKAPNTTKNYMSAFYHTIEKKNSG